MQDDCVIFEVKVNADAPHGVSWDRFEPFTSCMSLTVDFLDKNIRFAARSTQATWASRTRAPLAT